MHGRGSYYGELVEAQSGRGPDGQPLPQEQDQTQLRHKQEPQPLTKEQEELIRENDGNC